MPKFCFCVWILKWYKKERWLPMLKHWPSYKSYCSAVNFRRITSIYQQTNAHIISHKTLLKHFKTLRYVSIFSDHHQGALFLAKVILHNSQFNSYLQTRCCGCISCCGAVARCESYDAHLGWVGTGAGLNRCRKSRPHRDSICGPFSP